MGTVEVVWYAQGLNRVRYAEDTGQVGAVSVAILVTVMMVIMMIVMVLIVVMV